MMVVVCVGGGVGGINEDIEELLSTVVNMI